MSGLVTITEGEFTGWQHWESDAFEQIAGPFYERIDENGEAVLAFRVQPRHLNGAGVVHGGCLMTFADFAMFSIAYRELKDHWAVTINLSGDFLDAIRAGQLVEARGEVTRAGGKTIFVRGLVTADGKPALSFTGIIRKVSAR